VVRLTTEKEATARPAIKPTLASTLGALVSCSPFIDFEGAFLADTVVLPQFV
jgi:hypothetical protein